MSRHSVMFCRFPGGNSEHPATTDWFAQTVIRAKADPRIDRVNVFKISDTPITMCRNRACEAAKAADVDIVVMVDSDMHPDLYLGADPNAHAFWDTSLNFLLNKMCMRPCAIGAPYCGPAPIENVYVFRWGANESESPDTAHRLVQFGREEAAQCTGIMEVAALPTGLIMFPTKALELLEPPYFYYEWEDKTQSQKASTEDVTFTRDLSLQGAPQWCNFSAWAGHYKQKCVGRPTVLTVRDVSDRYVAAIGRNAASRAAAHQVEGGETPTNGKCALPGAVSPERLASHDEYRPGCA